MRQNEHLNNLQRSVEASRDEAQRQLEKLGENATFADRFGLVAAQSHGDFFRKVAANTPLSFEELNAEPVAPHLLQTIVAPVKRAPQFDARAIITGEPVSGHEIQIRFLGHFFVHLQDLTNALAQWLSFNQSDRGPLQRSIVGNNRLQLAGVFQSSFGVELSVAPTEAFEDMNQEPSLFPELQTPLPNEALEKLQLLLDGSARNSHLVEILTHPRVKTHYQSLIDLVAKGGADISFETRSQPNPVSITTQQARVRSEWLQNLQTNDEVQLMNGTIVGGSLERNRFELRIDKDTFLEGRMSKEATSTFARSFGRLVRATILVSTTTDETGNQKATYFLLGLSLDSEHLL